VRDGLVEFGPAPINGSYQVALVYRTTHPFSVTIAANTPDRAREGAERVQVRPASEFERR
jgi:hypothetical protein